MFFQVRFEPSISNFVWTSMSPYFSEIDDRDCLFLENEETAIKVTIFLALTLPLESECDV